MPPPTDLLDDGGSVSPPGFLERAREMDAKWERGEYPIQQIMRGLAMTPPDPKPEADSLDTSPDEPDTGPLDDDASDPDDPTIEPVAPTEDPA